MRCMITANRRASATIAFFIPRCLAIFIAQALSQDHFGDLAVGRSKRTCELTSSIVPRGTLFHRLVELEFPPVILSGLYAATASLVHLNSVPSIQMRCIMTAK